MAPIALRTAISGCISASGLPTRSMFLVEFHEIISPSVGDTGMARRRKRTNILEDLFELAAALPWWVGVVLAVVTYALLHRYAAGGTPLNAPPGQIGVAVVSQLTRIVAGFAQYLVPLLFLGGAAASFVWRRKRQALVRDAAQGKSGDGIRNISWQDFELLVGQAFRMRGFSVTETGGGGADGGIDLKLSKGGESFLVQCKQWRAYKVSVSVVRELFGLMAAESATGGFVVTSGVFTADAQSFAKGRNIELIDGPALQAMIETSRSDQPAAARPEKTLSNPLPHSSPADEPSCPRCGKTMVTRVAKQGPNAGGAFWGCPSFPSCRGVRTID